jgi:hypothetical protein
MHCLVLDGVYRTIEGVPVFHIVRAPTAGTSHETANTRAPRGRLTRPLASSWPHRCLSVMNPNHALVTDWPLTDDRAAQLLIAKEIAAIAKFVAAPQW